MKIDKIISQSRRDFRATYICEHCGYIKEGTGYDDSFFHQNVIPKMKCEQCGRVSGEDYRPLTTKYPDGFQV
jgi:primosomal protein N'